MLDLPARFLPVLALALLFLTPNLAWSFLSEEEADQRLREMGLNVDDPSFPPDLIEAFRAMVREMYLNLKKSVALTTNAH